jgi:hypothetical protein
LREQLVGPAATRADCVALVRRLAPRANGATMDHAQAVAYTEPSYGRQAHNFNGVRLTTGSCGPDFVGCHVHAGGFNQFFQPNPDWCRLRGEFGDTQELCESGTIQTALGPRPGTWHDPPGEVLPDCFAEFGVAGAPAEHDMRDTCNFDGPPPAGSCATQPQFNALIADLDAACCGKAGGGCEAGVPTSCNEACGAAVEAVTADCAVLMAGMPRILTASIAAAAVVCNRGPGEGGGGGDYDELFRCGTGGPETAYPSSDGYDYCSDNAECPCGPCCSCECDVPSGFSVMHGGNAGQGCGAADYTAEDFVVYSAAGHDLADDEGFVGTLAECEAACCAGFGGIECVGFSRALRDDDAVAGQCWFKGEVPVKDRNANDRTYHTYLKQDQGKVPAPTPTPAPTPVPKGGNPACWSGVYTEARCCDASHGMEGDRSCWAGTFNYAFCCQYASPGGGGH